MQAEAQVTEPTKVGAQNPNAPRTPAPRRATVWDYLRSAVAIPLIYLYTVVMASISLTVSFFDEGGRRQHWCAQTWCKLIAVTAGMKVRVHGAENIAPGVSYVFLSSHQSYLDIAAMLGYLPAQLRIAAKKSLFKIPFMGWHLARAGHIPIDRKSHENAVAAMQKAAEYLTGGVCVFLYPEGTRSRDGRLQPFKKGGFKLALQAAAPIIPVTVIGTRQALPVDSIIFRPGAVDMFVDAPIPTAGLTEADLDALMQQVWDTMARRYREAW
jgi:1-acyl-sn-glycerol-3-phosphate acyltransferase